MAGELEDAGAIEAKMEHLLSRRRRYLCSLRHSISIELAGLAKVFVVRCFDSITNSSCLRCPTPLVFVQR